VLKALSLRFRADFHTWISTSGTTIQHKIGSPHQHKVEKKGDKNIEIVNEI
jgi:hypothetical protein